MSKRYASNGASVAALDDVSLDVEPGEFVSLVGRSGCGKTTLLNLAGAMDFPTSGQVLLDGSPTAPLEDAALTRLRREKVGFVFQSFHLLPTLTAVENVELPLQLAGRSEGIRDQALEQLAAVEMEGYADRLPHQISGGQAQRIAIARAVVHRPKLLLADEPIGNLDSSSAEIVMRLLRRIADSGTAILMATHSLEAAEITDTLVRLKDGRLEERRSLR